MLLHQSKYWHYRYYIGCQCFHENGGQKTFTALMYQQIEEELIAPPTLVLRELKNMTDEDSIYCARLLFPRQTESVTDEQYIEVGKRVVSDYFYPSGKYAEQNHCPHSMRKILTDLLPYLLNKSYNLFFYQPYKSE